jgi:hypothetical protein
LPAFGLINRLQVGDTGPVESARRSNSRVLGSPFSGLLGQVQIFLYTVTVKLTVPTIYILQGIIYKVVKYI